jgi:hypothetical protein
MLEDLYIDEDPHSQLDWKDNIESRLWLGLLHPFTAVKNLYLSERFAQSIGPALQELVGSKPMEVFPTLQNIFLKGLQPSGPVQEGIGQFISWRQVTGRPIAVSRWGDSYSEQVDLSLEQVDLYSELDDSHSEQDDSYSEQDDSYSEQDDSFSEQDDVYMEQDDLDLEQDDTYTEQVDLYAERVDLYLEQDDLHSEQGDLYSEQNDLHLEQVDLYSEQGEVLLTWED